MHKYFGVYVEKNLLFIIFIEKIILNEKAGKDLRGDKLDMHKCFRGAMAWYVFCLNQRTMADTPGTWKKKENPRFRTPLGGVTPGEARYKHVPFKPAHEDLC